MILIFLMQRWRTNFLMTSPLWHNVNFIDPSKLRKWIFRASYLSIESTIALKISVLTSSMSRPTVCRPVRNFFRHSLNRCFFLPSFLKNRKNQLSLNFLSHGICSDLWWDFVNNVLVITAPILEATLNAEPHQSQVSFCSCLNWEMKNNGVSAFR